MIKNFAMFRYTGSGEILELDLGFVPDFVWLQIEGAATACVTHIWSRMLEENGAAAIAGGMKYTEGVTALFTHGNGIEVFEGKKKTPTISRWTTAVSTAATARAGAVAGTYVSPTMTSDYDKSAVFECVTAGTGTAVEPNWNSAPAIGDRVKDGAGGDTEWERVNVAQVEKQCAGIEIAAALAVNDTIYWGYAIRGDIVKDFGDVANLPVGVTASSRIASLP